MGAKVKKKNNAPLKVFVQPLKNIYKSRINPACKGGWRRYYLANVCKTQINTPQHSRGFQKGNKKPRVLSGANRRPLLR